MLVATVRALKAHRGKYRSSPASRCRPICSPRTPTTCAPARANLIKQIENVKVHGVSPVVAINAFPGDFASEHQAIREIAEAMGARVAVCTHFSDGGKGATELAEAVVEACDEPIGVPVLYPDSASLKEKIETVATKIYGAGERRATRPPPTSSSPLREERLRPPAGVHRQDAPVDLRRCVAEGCARRATRSPCVRCRASVGAGFVYPICGDMRTMPGLGTKPAASIIDFDDDGEIIGLS